MTAAPVLPAVAGARPPAPVAAPGVTPEGAAPTVVRLGCTPADAGYLAGLGGRQPRKGYPLTHTVLRGLDRRRYLGVLVAPTRLRDGLLPSAVGEGWGVIGLALLWHGRTVEARPTRSVVQRYRVVHPPVPARELGELLLPAEVLAGRDAVLGATGTELLAALAGARPALRGFLDEVAPILRAELPADAASELWAAEKDAVGTGLRIARIRHDVLVDWQAPASGLPFLHGLPDPDGGPQRRLDSLDEPPEWLPRGELGAGAALRVFDKGRQRLVVAGLRPPGGEEPVAVDFFYVHERSDTLVLVHHRPLPRPGARGTAPDARDDERLQRLLRRLQGLDGACEGMVGSEFRLVATPSWVKLYEPEFLDPDATEPVQGMYLPLRHFEQALGAAGDTPLRDAVDRHLSGSEFVRLAADGWLGSGGADLELVGEQVGASLDAGHAVVVADHRSRG